MIKVSIIALHGFHNQLHAANAASRGDVCFLVGFSGESKQMTKSEKPRNAVFSGLPNGADGRIQTGDLILPRLPGPSVPLELHTQ